VNDAPMINNISITMMRPTDHFPNVVIGVISVRNVYHRIYLGLNGHIIPHMLHTIDTVPLHVPVWTIDQLSLNR
jgi:hypothetical protein